MGRLKGTTVGFALLATSVATTTEVRAQDLASFAVLAGSAITNTGATTITGNVGVYPGSSITGFGTVTLTGSIYQTDAVAMNAQDQLTTLYNILASRPTSPGGNLTGTDLGGLTLTPGVYNFASSAQLTGTLQLDAQGDPNAVFIFNIGSALTTAPDAVVTMINHPGGTTEGGNVFFRVGSSATLDTSTSFLGQIVALSAISLKGDAEIICGAALARKHDQHLYPGSGRDRG